MKFFITLILSFIFFNSYCQTDSVINKKKLFITSSILCTTYSGTMFYLGSAWYSKYERSSFHFFDDSNEWLQMDKIGHAFSSYYLSNIIDKSIENCNIKHNKAVIIGSSASFIAVSAIELFDGFQSKWGASVYDLSANFCGSVLYSSQELIFKKQLLRLKFSYYPTNLYLYSSNTLGNNYIERIFKDYNAQTYWLSGNFKQTFGIKIFPQWLNFAFGYSANNMLGGTNNNSYHFFLNKKRIRQYYFSLDADLTKIKTKHKLLNTIFKTINVIKIPFPAISLEENKIGFKGIYF